MLDILPRQSPPHVVRTRVDMEHGLQASGCAPRITIRHTSKLGHHLCMVGERIVAGTYQAIRELKEGSAVREAKVDPKKAPGKA